MSATSGLMTSQCFSDLERLRIAQSSAQNSAQNSAQSSTLPRPSTSSSHGLSKASIVASLTSRPTLARRNSSYFKNPSFFRSKKPSPTTDTFSHSDAQWYQNLPSKIQRDHFTEEERTFLSGHRPQTASPDAADLRVFELSKFLETARSLPSTRSTASLRTLSTASQTSISTFEALDDMDDSMMDTFNFFDNDDDLDLASTLDDYHRFYALEAGKKKSSNHHPSFRKVMSLSSIPLAASRQEQPPPPPPLPTKYSVTATPTPQQATSPLTPTFLTHSPNFSRPAPNLPHKANASTTNLDPTPTYYQDPSTRLKLRIFASPQKFDEAIEFGFPSMDDADTQPMSRPSLSQPRPSLSQPRPSLSTERPSLSIARPSLSKTRQYATAPPSSTAGQTFLDDSPSVIDGLDSAWDDEDDTQSLPERNSPYTPQDSHFDETYLLSPSVASYSSPPSTFGPTHKEFAPFQSKPNLRHDPAEPLAQVLAGTRDMTLRMTLTRPELRVDEKELYKRTSEEDPLALEHLPVMPEKPGDVWDSLPSVKQSGLRKIWRKVSGKC